MKLFTLIISLFFLILPLFSFSQTKWLIINPDFVDFVVETKIDGDKIIGYTRKNALKDYLSPIQLFVLKKKMKFNYNEFVYLEAKKTDLKNEFIGTMYEFKSSSNIIISLYNDSLKLKILNPSDTLILKGVKVGKDYQQNDYSKLYNDIFSKTDSTIFNISYSRTKNYLKAKNELLENSTKMFDNYEFFLSFYLATRMKRKLDFTHFYLTKNQQNIISTTNITLKEINANTCVLDVDGFVGDNLKMDTLLEKIKLKKYQNLIIDLRNNGGGSFETASPLGNFISSKPLIAGFFPNNNWYKLHDRYPTLADTSLFSSFNNGTIEEFYQVANTKSGVYFKTKPDSEVFNGKIFLLVNHRTGSTSEAVTMAIKEYKLGLVVGTKTAGSLLSIKWFKLNDMFNLAIPTNDFISTFGYRVDKKGIEPDINTGNEDALEYVLKYLVK